MRVMLVLWLLALAPAALAGEPRVEYRVTLDAPQTQTVHITVTLRGVGDDHVDLRLPTWRPGRYIILDMAGTVRNEHAHTSSGDPLSIHKTDKSTWRVGTNGADTITVEYDVYANSIDDRTRHVDDTHAFLSGESVFMYADGWRNEPLRVTIDAPDAWDIASGLEPEADDPTVLVAPNYDRLVDSPIEAGVHQRFRFLVDNVPHEIVTWGRAEPDAEKLRADFATIVREQSKVFGDIPYQRYVFLIHSAPGLGGGTEHWNSTIMQTRPESFTDDEAYKGFLGLVSHEFFHTWNVKRLRPAGITPYDYQHENYTDLLWVAEGTTSYYDDLTLVRGGLIDTDEYLKRISKSIDALRSTPGRRVQSLTESSHDAWIKFNKRTPDSPNSTVSFYGKGALVSLLLDMALRDSSNDAYSLDNLMHSLYVAHPLESGGFTEADLIAAAHRDAGWDPSRFFDSFVRGTEPLPFEEALSRVALAVEFAPDDEDTPATPWIGLVLRAGDGAPVVRTAYSDGPAYDAGLNPGDELIAANGTRLRAPADLDAVVERLDEDEPLTITVSRRDVMRDMVVRPMLHPAGSWKVRRIDEPDLGQRTAYQAWLGQPWPDNAGSPDGNAEESKQEEDR